MFISLRNLAKYTESHRDIVIPPGATIGVTDWEDTSRDWQGPLDLLSLLRALKRSPDTTIELRDGLSWYPDTDYLQSLIDVHGNSAWAACFEEELEHVWMIYSSYKRMCAEVYLEIKPKYVDEAWMRPLFDTFLGYYPCELGTTTIYEQKGWLEKVGLKELEGWQRLHLAVHWPKKWGWN